MIYAESKMRLKYKLYTLFNAAKSLNDRVEVENELLAMAAGKQKLPNQQKCFELAMKLGVPKKYRNLRHP